MDISLLALERLRKKLLDLSFRNKLLNFKHNQSALRVIDELPNQIADTLLSGSKMSFIAINDPKKEELINEGYIEYDKDAKKDIIIKKHPSAKEWAKIQGFNTSFEMPDDYVDDIEDIHSDKYIQTLFYSYEMEKRLKKIHQQSTASINETGSNILYLCIGFLEWKEGNQEDSRTAISPLFSIPVNSKKGKLNIERNVYEYTISYSGDELIENLSLKEKLDNNFGLNLPKLEEGDTPEEYLLKVENVIEATHPDWSVKRYITLGLLNFSKLLMYKDLDPANWIEGENLLNHHIISQLIGRDNEREDETSDKTYDFLEEYEIDNISNIHERFPLIFDADSSQHSAIIDAINGKDLVIEGPPGTGKSQTISNLIAAAIGQGKSILFMSEKQAALNVVYEKLNNAGLGDFCLNLHDPKSPKRQILDSIEKRLSNKGKYEKPNNINAEIEYYESLKKELSGYVDTVNKEWKESGFSLHEILSKAARFSTFLTTKLLSLVDLDVKDITRTQLSSYEDKLKSISILADSLIKKTNATNSIKECKWYGFNNYEIQTYEYTEVLDLLKNWNSSLQDYINLESRLSNEYDFISPSPLFQKDPEVIIEINEIIIKSERVDFENINNIDKENLGYLYDCLAQFKELNFNKNLLLEGVSDQTLEGLLFNNTLPVDLHSDLDRIHTNLNKNELDVLVTKIDGIDRDLQDIGNLIEKANQIYSDLKIQSTINGVNSLTNLIKVVTSIKPRYISFRNSLFDRVEVEDLIDDLVGKVEESRKFKEDVESIYKFDNLPDTNRLEDIEEALKEEGIIRWFKSNYREARKELQSFAKNKYIKFNDLLSGLDKVYKYRDCVEQINKGEFKDHFGNYLSGDDTDVESISAVIAWYKDIRNIYGTGFGKGFELRDSVKNISNSSLQELQSLFSGGDFNLIDSSIKNLTDIKSNFKLDFDKDNIDLYGENSPIYKIKNIVRNVVSSVNKILLLGNNDTPIEQLVASYDSFMKYEKLKSNWNSIDDSVYFKNFKFNLVDSIESTLDFVELINRGIKNKQLSNYVVSNLSSQLINDLKDLKDLIESAYEHTIYTYNLFETKSKLNIEEWLIDIDRNTSNVISRNTKAIDSFEHIKYWVDYIRKLNNLKETELNNLVTLCNDYGTFEDAIPSLNAYVFNKLSIEMLKDYQILEHFSSAEHDNKIERFIKCDNKLKELQRDEISFNSDNVSRIINGKNAGPTRNWTELSLLVREISKKTKHIPTRRLLSRATSTIKSLKPCFMMSPMSVSLYLEPGKIDFDLIIMDEASQIRPEDALSTIARGKQLVVVGDPKQLPPSNFFMKNDDEEEEEEDERSAIEGQESILDACLGLLELRRLRWHYRSRHHSLIAFSNYKFYDNNLVIFPSPSKDSKSLGIRYSKIGNGTFVDRRNIEEARIVALSVKSHMMNNHNESLGVVAMNAQQRKQIDDELEILTKEDNKFAEIYDRNLNLQDEYFFIKNLENVQGDERDVMYISMTYGPTQIGGKVYKRFGDINKSSGWRRLNVLLTRSKKRMNIFSSLDSSDVPNTGSRGVTALNSFLKYCETGNIERTDVSADRQPDSDFEISVMEMLSMHGFECIPQVGEAGFFIDIAVRDPNKPGKFLMAIECDGATYHSSKSARDRDRLKQQILEGLGWNVKRIWSTDWFRDSKSAIKDILVELNNLKSEIIDIKDEFDEECEIDEIINNQDKTKNIDAHFSDLGVGIREKLIKFNNEIITKEFPETKDENRLLSSFMLDSLVENQPWDKSEFLELIPEHIREYVDRRESARFLNDVLNIISSSMD